MVLKRRGKGVGVDEKVHIKIEIGILLIVDGIKRLEVVEGVGWSHLTIGRHKSLIVVGLH